MTNYNNCIAIFLKKNHYMNLAATLKIKLSCKMNTWLRLKFLTEFN